jgi:hypothetical protein
MNNSSIYGDIFYEYSFFQGINDKEPILVPFETIYYAAKDEIPEEIKMEIIEMSKKEKQEFYFDTITQFLFDNIDKYKLKHILVYLHNTEKINLMKNKIENIIKKTSNNCNVYTIYSDQPKSEQTNNLVGFRKNTKYSNILLSVGMFDEGVDEPCIDTVMFAEERNTESKIVQNIGRCLRLYTSQDKTYTKKKSYVIIPNVVYEFNNDNNLANISYSSCYKKIRKVISVLNKPYNSNGKFFSRYVKGNEPNGLDSDDDDQIDKGDKYKNTEIVLSNDLTELNNNINNINLSKYYEQLCTNESINNESLENIKNKIIEFKINNIKEYSNYFIKTPYFILHNEFKTEWISWSHILFDNVFSYNEAKDFFNGFNKTFNDSTEWIKFYNNILFNELNNKREADITDNIFNEIIKIPNRPKEYYKGEWIDWNDFLGLNTLNQTTLLINTTANAETIVDKNIRTFLNTDSEKVMKFNKGDYNDIILKSDLSPIKNYIDAALGISFKLKPRISLKSNGNFDKFVINCYKTNCNSNKPLSIIYPEEKKYIYDHINLNNDINYNTDIKRTKEIFIQNNEIIKLFKNIIIECKDILSKAKHNI